MEYPNYPYLQCAGVKDENRIMIQKHNYNDGKLHIENSHGLCPDCAMLTGYIGELYRGLTEQQKLDCKLLLKYNRNKPLNNIEEAFLTREGGLFERVTK